MKYSTSRSIKLGKNTFLEQKQTYLLPVVISTFHFPYNQEPNHVWQNIFFSKHGPGGQNMVAAYEQKQFNESLKRNAK